MSGIGDGVKGSGYVETRTPEERYEALWREAMDKGIVMYNRFRTEELRWQRHFWNLCEERRAAEAELAAERTRREAALESYHKAAADCDRWRARCEAAIGLLLEVEWHGRSRVKECPFCRAGLNVGRHESSCRLAAVLPDDAPAVSWCALAERLGEALAAMTEYAVRWHGLSDDECAVDVDIAAARAVLAEWEAMGDRQ